MKFHDGVRRINKVDGMKRKAHSRSVRRAGKREVADALR
jgi:hypothetical protein